MSSSPSSKIVTLAKDIKLSHSVFALPFAILGAYLASASKGELLHEDWVSLLLILVCMFLARTMAMTINRLADYKIDQLNPRTQGRAIPSGRLSYGYVLAVTILCGVGFIWSSSGFYFLNGNYWPLVLSPVVLIWLSAYSFMKRYTALCHIFLGSALAISPLAAGIAMNPKYFKNRRFGFRVAWCLLGCWLDVI